MKFKLVQRKNPNKRDEPAKWYASPMNDEAEDIKTMTRSATANTTTAPIEMEASLELFGEYAKKKLLRGESIRIGNLGTLRLTFRSKGSDTVKEFNAAQLIYDARLLFTPSKEFRESIINNLTYENGGVLEDGIEYADLESYYKAKGINVDENPEDSGTDSGEDDGPQVQ